MRKALSSIGESPVFLDKRLNFLAVVAVLLTTLFGWFNPNSWCIGLLVLCRLLDGKPLENIRTAFTNKLFLAYFIFFLIDAAGYLHTHNMVTQGKIVVKEATLVAIAFAFCGGRFADQKTYRQLITAYSLLLLLVSFYCLGLALHNYQLTKDSSVFFYHALTAPISQNAVFYSVFVLFGIIFLLSPQGSPVIGWLSPKTRRSFRIALVLFFLGMIVLLSSRLLLIVTLLVMINTFSRRYSFRKNKRAFLVTGSTLFLAVCVLFMIDNPIRARFKEMQGDLDVVKQQTFNPNMYFNSLQSRLVEGRFAIEVLNSRHAWLFGVSPGDSQDLLDQKYIDTKMDIGDPSQGPDRKIRGFIGYNYHNQYTESLVKTGILGLVSLLSIFFLLFAGARKQGAKESWFIILTLAIFFIPEAPLTLQHGIFLFCFFPLLALNAPRVARLAAS
ncbi:MAG TPA: O-antigen ligase family protein [Puia sp.]|jgi:O-antigen ligase|nr:O-antigen ligase family protein [Puia sp.]